jgi:DNA-directed RNA polymerase specialized sigma24 family protein
VLSARGAAADQNRRLSEIIAREQARLRRFIVARVPDTGDAEDILQEVFYELIPAYRLMKSLAVYLRYQTTHDRAFHKSLNTLLKLRAEKRKAEIGFVSQQRQSEEHARKQAAEKRKQEIHKWKVCKRKPR